MPNLAVIDVSLGLVDSTYFVSILFDDERVIPQFVIKEGTLVSEPSETSRYRLTIVSDGPFNGSDIAPNDRSDVVASIVHDWFYLSHKENKNLTPLLPLADDLYYAICVHSGMSKYKALWRYAIIRVYSYFKYG